MHTPFWHRRTPQDQAIVLLELFYEPKSWLSRKLVPPDRSSGENPLVTGGGKNVSIKEHYEPKPQSFARLH